MTHTIQRVRRSGKAILEPIGDVIDAPNVIEFMNAIDLDGVVDVTPGEGYAEYPFAVTFAFDGSDAIGEATYLPTFDPHMAFPHVPRHSAPIPEPRV